MILFYGDILLNRNIVSISWAQFPIIKEDSVMKVNSSKTGTYIIIELSAIYNEITCQNY